MADQQDTKHDGEEMLPLPALPAPPPPPPSSPPPEEVAAPIRSPYTRSGTMAAVIEEEDEDTEVVDASMPTPPSQPELPPPPPPPPPSHSIPPAEAAQLDQIMATGSSTPQSSTSTSASAAAAAKQKRQSLFLGGVTSNSNTNNSTSTVSNNKNSSSSRALSNSCSSASSFPLDTHPSFRSRFQRTARLTGKGMERSLAHVRYWGKTVVETLLQSVFWDMLLFLVTLYMLTGETWRLLYVLKEDDQIMEAFNLFALLVVVVDLLLRVLDSRSVGGGGGTSNRDDGPCRVRYLYLTSFQFWMDFLSMVPISCDVGLWYFCKQHWPVWDLDKQAYFAVGEALRVLCLLRLAHLARWVNMEKLVFCGCGGWFKRRRRRRGQEQGQGGGRKSSSINDNTTVAGGPSRQSSSKVAPMLGETSSSSPSRRGWSTRSSSSFRDSSSSFSDTHNNNNNKSFSLMATSLIKSLRWTSRRISSSNSTNTSSRNLDEDTASWGNNGSSSRRQTKQQLDNSNNNNNPASSSSPAAEHSQSSKSRVGAKFLEVTLRKVIIVIVLLSLCFPLLSPSRFLYAHPVYRYHKFGLQQLHALAEQIYPTPTTVPTPAEEALLKANFQDYMLSNNARREDWSRPLYLKLQNVPLATTNQWLQEVNVVMASSLTELQSQYRPIEIPRYRLASSTGSTSDSDTDTEAFFFGQPRLQDCSRRNMELRLCVLVLFFLVGALFTGAQKIVIAPIERMTKIVTLLKENPLAKLDKRQHHHHQHHSTKKQQKKKTALEAAADITAPSTPTSPIPTPTTESSSSASAAAERPKLSPRSLTLRNALKSSLSRRHLHYSTNKSQTATSAAEAQAATTEMDLLENVLLKISELLQIGFGAAGAELISKNMIPGSTDVKQLLSLGKRKQCIFGFVKIEDFSVMCGCLQEDVCTYINTIAKVVHGNVMEFQGEPNKNTGNAFFCVWKMKDSSGDQQQQQQDGGGTLQAARSPPPPSPLSPLSSSPSPRVFDDNNNNNGTLSGNWGSVAFQQQTQEQQRMSTSAALSPSGAPPPPPPPAPTPTPTPRSGRFMPTILPLLSNSLTSPFSPRTVATPTTTTTSPAAPAARMSSSRIHSPMATLADKALAAVVKTRVELHCLQTHPDLTQFTRRPAVVARLGEDYAVKLKYGLHIGWAIEGALGSQYKIDATYLSPHVNLASRLEAATHQFGTPCLMSGDFVSQLSPAIRLLCRQLDSVTVKGSERPLEIWTFDISDWPDDLSLFHLSSTLRYSATRRTSTRHHGSSQRLLINGGGGGAAAALTEQDLALVLQGLQRSLNPFFLQHHSQALQHYFAGDWDKAHHSFTQALTLKPNDEPTQCLLQVLEGNNKVAPEGWIGCRKLHGK